MLRLNVIRIFRLPNLLICGLSIYAGSALAESKTERLPEFEDVYRIELIIFTNRNNLDAFNDNDDNTNSEVAEEWSAKPELSYPDKLVFLHPGPLEPVTSENNDGTVNIPAPQREELVKSIPESELNSGQQADTRTAVEKALASLPLLEYVDSETHLLKDMAKSIGRRSNHKVLFHQAWHQELGAAEIAPSIPISGGETFDNHRELEGSIKLNKDRYLHITSDLWLTQYVLRNDAQWDKFTTEPTENSLLAAKIIDVNPVPDFPLDVVRIAEETAIREAALAKLLEDEALYEFSLEQDSSSANASLRPLPLPLPLPFDDDVIDESLESEALEAHIEVLVSEAAELSFDLFEASKTYVLKEHRKMKRAEVHFLDHPMMGLIIQITKYEVPVNAESTEGS